MRAYCEACGQENLFEEENGEVYCEMCGRNPAAAASAAAVQKSARRRKLLAPLPWLIGALILGLIVLRSPKESAGTLLGAFAAVSLTFGLIWLVRKGSKGIGLMGSWLRKNINRE